MSWLTIRLEIFMLRLPKSVKLWFWIDMISFKKFRKICLWHTSIFYCYLIKEWKSLKSIRLLWLSNCSWNWIELIVLRSILRLLRFSISIKIKKLCLKLKRKLLGKIELRNMGYLIISAIWLILVVILILSICTKSLNVG